MKTKQKIIIGVFSLGLIISNLSTSNTITPSNVVTSSNIESVETMKVHFIDVGQGDAIYIKAPYGEDILIDTGDEPYGKTVVNYLKEQNVKDIDHLILTHSDVDHIGGADDVLNAFPVKKVYYPGDATKDTRAFEKFVNAANQERGCSIDKNIENRTLDVKGITAKFIQPNKDYKEVNDDSLVLFVDYENTELLFTGDLSTEAELDMVKQNLVPDIDVLKVSHHGSKYSSSQEFLKKSTPKYSIISVGEQNNYGHPTREVLDRLENIESKIWRTDKNGNIIMSTDGNEISFNGNK